MNRFNKAVSQQGLSTAAEVGKILLHLLQPFWLFLLPNLCEQRVVAVLQVLKLFRLSTFIRMQEPCGCPVAFSNVNVREASFFQPKEFSALLIGSKLGATSDTQAGFAHICSPKMDLDGSISTRIAFQELQLRTCSRHLENPSCGSSGELSRCGLQCISSPAEACSQSEMW